MNARTVRQSFCRVCNCNCGILVAVENGRVTRVTGDPAHPVSAGYTCVKGRAQPELLAHHDRLLRSRKRVGSDFVDIDVEQAMDEIAGQLGQIRDRHGPRAIASYLGTFITANHVTAPLIDSFMRELGSPMTFTPIPIDKPGKEISRALHGTWQAPAQGFDRPDVCLLIGANPFVSYTGFPSGNPSRWLKEQTDRGMRLIVVDPRVTPVARRAFFHLQPRPGHDPAILAAMIRVILAEDLLDARFVAEHAEGLDTLRSAVAPFDPAVVAAAADVPADDLVLAARDLVRAARLGLRRDRAEHVVVEHAVRVPRPAADDPHGQVAAGGGTGPQPAHPAPAAGPPRAGEPAAAGPGRRADAGARAARERGGHAHRGAAG